MSTRARLLVATVSTGLVFYIAVGSVLGRVMGDTTYGQLTVFNEVIRMVIDSYVEPIDLDRTMSGAYLGLTDALDGDSVYLDAADYRLFSEQEGDEADVGLVLTRRHAFLMIVGTRAGSPAREADLRTGDLIKTIDGRHTRYVSVPVAERLLSGEPGASVRLEIHRAGSDLLEVELVRERLAAAPVRSERLEGDVARLVIPELSADTASAARAELQALRSDGVARLVLDLRGATSGPLEQGVRLAELFLDGGVATRLQRKNSEERQLEASPEERVWSDPLVVLTSHGTAGGAEIAAAALRDAGRAELVGEHTFGRAAVQRAFPLPEGGLLLTVATYRTPKGEPIHGRGLRPDHAVASVRPAEGEEAADPILAKALELLGAAEEPLEEAA
jgi:carboxyl-terminal processing protease